MSKLNWKNVMTVACALVAALFLTIMNNNLIEFSVDNGHPTIVYYGLFFAWVAVAFAVASIFAEGNISKWLVFAGLIVSIMVAFALTVYSPAICLSNDDGAETDELAELGGFIAFDCVFFISEVTFASLNVAKN